MPDPKPRDGALLPHYAGTLERIRTDLDLTTRQMARALGDTDVAEMLTRSGGTHVDHTTMRAIELGRNWPRNPDVWAAAYGELAGMAALQVWGEAFCAYAVATGRS